ncbi:MAG: hypothetical protein PSV40_15490 [Polaromonas sp.]|uniref:hypothetical protein n=1 Tax=Polaromonas sp. TaxID=1869339 RepID=UPI0024873903|nr:hypothetical protein [Polaromonas sp.]MDI1270490.1 hypothetical protein [Polaromonas sp.]
MINEEAAKALLDASKIIYRWAKKGDTSEENETPVSKRAHEAAWRAVSHLIPVLEHAKESDLFWTLAENSIRVKKSVKEQQRLYAIAKQEDREFMRSKAALEKLICDAVIVEKADPRGLIDKAKAEQRKLNGTAADARKAEEAAIGKAIKQAKSAKEKAELIKRYDRAMTAYRDILAKAEEDTEAVYLRLGLTPMCPSAKFLKAQKAKKKAAGNMTN